MRNAIVAVLSIFALAERGEAQVIGTYGTPGAQFGYYSPYPGALYSPYLRPAPQYAPTFRPYYNPGFPNGTIYAPRYVPNAMNFSRNGYGQSPNNNNKPYRRR